MAKMKRPRESVRRWWMDRDGTVWINVHSARRKPITEAEIEAINRAVDEKEARGEDTLN
jgi:hypothetical protein